MEFDGGMPNPAPLLEGDKIGTDKALTTLLPAWSATLFAYYTNFK